MEMVATKRRKTAPTDFRTRWLSERFRLEQTSALIKSGALQTPSTATQEMVEVLQKWAAGCQGPGTGKQACSAPTDVSHAAAWE